MLTSITVQNFKSFGEEQTIPLEPITVLVGPNNSGKSNLVSLARFIRNATTAGPESAFEQEGGIEFVRRRPPIGDACIGLGWKVDAGTDEEGAYVSSSMRRKVGSDSGASVSAGPSWAKPGNASTATVQKPNISIRGKLGLGHNGKIPSQWLGSFARSRRATPT